MGSFTHFDESGRARMVDVGAKPITLREARATGSIRMSRQTFEQITAGTVSKGDVLGVARLAAVMAAKKTSDLIPLCHPLSLSGVDVDFHPDAAAAEIGIEVRVRAADRTGVEMEALLATAIAALTIYDMCKGADRGMSIHDIKLVEKRGGKSGHYRAPEP